MYRPTGHEGLRPSIGAESGSRQVAPVVSSAGSNRAESKGEVVQSEALEKRSDGKGVWSRPKREGHSGEGPEGQERGGTRTKRKAVSLILSLSCG